MDRLLERRVRKQTEIYLPRPEVSTCGLFFGGLEKKIPAIWDLGFRPGTVK
jgi:hypothetical protein